MKYSAFAKGYAMAIRLPTLLQALDAAKARARLFGSGFVLTGGMVPRKVVSVFSPKR